jgi:hypothetical protein
VSVIDTKPPALPVRAWRWCFVTLVVFWCDFGEYLRGEIEAIRRRP